MAGFPAFLESIQAQPDDHPFLRRLTELSRQGMLKAKSLEVRRPRSALGFEPAVMFLHIDLTDGRTELHNTLWDDDLNLALVQRGVTALDRANEVTRFGLALRETFQKPERRFGDGFFSSVLVDVLQETGMARAGPIHDILRDVSTHPPHKQGNSYGFCREMIEAALKDAWEQLTGPLTYPRADAQAILLDALAYYLDERFTVTDRRKLGWAK